MANENPILDSHMYEVEYQDLMKASLVANYIAENLFAEVDQEGNRHVLLDKLIDFRVDGHEVKLQEHSSQQALRREGDKKPPLGGNSWPSGKTEAQIGYY